MLTGNLKTGSFRKFPTLVSYKKSTKFVRDFEAPDGTADSQVVTVSRTCAGERVTR